MHCSISVISVVDLPMCILHVCLLQCSLDLPFCAASFIGFSCLTATCALFLVGLLLMVTVVAAMLVAVTVEALRRCCIDEAVLLKPWIAPRRHQERCEMTALLTEADHVGNPIASAVKLNDV